MSSGVQDTPPDMDYEPGERVLCETGSGLSLGTQDLVVTLARAGGPVLVSETFMVVQPTVSSVQPTFGPISGGTELTIRGSGLDIGSFVNITLNGIPGPECSVV